MSGKLHDIKINSVTGKVLIDGNEIEGITQLDFNLKGGYNRKGSLTITLDAKSIEIEGKVLFNDDLKKLIQES